MPLCYHKPAERDKIVPGKKGSLKLLSFWEMEGRPASWRKPVEKGDMFKIRSFFVPTCSKIALEDPRKFV